MDNALRTREEEIRDASARRPHLVILGAGASVASFPQGDRNGRKLPVMADLVRILGLVDLLTKAGVPFHGRNFEDIYSSICCIPAYQALTSTIDDLVADYFRHLELPDGPTIYDYLVLCLRDKDVIATFNWDPFLWLACVRNHRRAKPPTVFFLHGCATVGYCEAHTPITMGPMGTSCRTCGKPYTATRLLFPVANKSYTDDPCIEAQWRTLRDVLKDAFLLTIFGYSAPITDAAAVELMSEAWGSPEQRRMEDIELIDILDEEQLVRRWDRFILSHHYTTASDFFGSVLAKHPRRSCEAMWAQNIEAQVIEENPVARCASLNEVWKWFEPLLLAERKQSSAEE
ncbi:MAG TPA: hypothetical protein VM031_01595 [Phycisphaerae bacterium]|nr:hypothetical protein [Phycisphaerae bacterium]